MERKLKTHPYFFGLQEKPKKPDKRKLDTFSANYSSYLEGYCNIFSSVLIFPYKLIRDEISGELKLSASKVKKISCILLHTVTCFAASVYMCALIKPWFTGKDNPYTIYHLGCTLAFYAYLCFVDLIWRRSSKLLKITNWFIQNNIPPVSNIKVWLICIIPICLSAVFNPPSKSFFILLGKPTDNSIFPLYFTSDDATKDCSDLTYATLRILDYLLSACFRCTHVFFLAGTGILSAVLFSVNVAVRSYRNRLKNYKVTEYWTSKRGEMLKHGLTAEADMRNLINLTNSLLGHRIISEYLMMVVFYAFVLKLFLASDSTLAERIHATAYSLYSMMFWIAACEVYYRVSSITKKWITKYRNLSMLDNQDVTATMRFDENRLLALQIETDNNPAGISCRCFTISYGFLGSMLGLIITLATVVFQLQSTSVTPTMPKTMHGL